MNEESFTVPFLTLCLLNERTRRHALDKLKLCDFFAAHFALYDDFLGTPSIEDLDETEFLLPAVVVGDNALANGAIKSGAALLKDLIRFKTDEEFYKSREFVYLNSLIQNSEEGQYNQEVDQLRAELFGLLDLQFTEFEIGFMEAVQRSVQVVLLEFLLHSIHQQN